MTFAELKVLIPDAIETEWHQHENGGGWVENTCTVDTSAFIDVNARVYGDAWVYGNARVSGNAQVYGDAWENSPLYIQGTRDAITRSAARELTIGCNWFPIEHWLENFRDIGADHGYSEAEIEEYGRYIELAAQIIGVKAEAIA